MQPTSWAGLQMNDTAKPADRFADLPEHTRRFFAGLDEDDLKTLDKGLSLFRTLEAFGRVTRWLILAILALFFGFVALWESIIKVLGWLRG